MTVHQSIPVRNGKSQATEDTIGPSPRLKFYDDGGAGEPADCVAAPTGTVLGTAVLPADWRSAPSGGAASMKGTWSCTAVAAGTAKYYRIYDSAEAVCHEQGTITSTGGGGNMTVGSTTVAIGNTLIVTSYTQTEGNA